MAEPATLTAAFGPWLRRERERRGLSLRALAALTDLSAGGLHNIESGASGSPGLRAVESLAAAFGKRPWALLLEVEAFAKVEAYAAAPHAAQGGDAEDRGPSAGEMREPAASDLERSRRLPGDILFSHETAGTETGDSLSPGITRVEDLTA